MLIIQESREGLYRYTINTSRPKHRAWLRHVFTNGSANLKIDRYLTWNGKEIKSLEELEKLFETEQNKRIEEKGDPDFITIGGHMYRKKYERFPKKVPKYLLKSEWGAVHNRTYGKGYAHLTPGLRIVYYF